MALYMMIFMGGTPAGAPLVGWIGEQYGARMTLFFGGAMTILGVLLASAVFLRLDRGRQQAAVSLDRRVLTPSG